MGQQTCCHLHKWSNRAFEVNVVLQKFDGIVQNFKVLSIRKGIGVCWQKKTI